jgi:hypothetical protein
VPKRVEHEYKRDSALHLFAAFDTRTGHAMANVTGASVKKSLSRFWNISTERFPLASR